MNGQQQIEAMAKLDGFEYCPSVKCEFRYCEHWHKDWWTYFNDNISIHQLPKYATSIDSCLSVIRKQPVEVQEKIANELYQLQKVSPETESFEIVMNTFELTPEQYLTATLKGCGVWRD